MIGYAYVDSAGNTLLYFLEEKIKRRRNKFNVIVFMAKMKTVQQQLMNISAADPHAKKALKDIRKTIKAAAPKAEEVISYQMPGYKYYGMLVYFAACKNHISFYPAPGELNLEKRNVCL